MDETSKLISLKERFDLYGLVIALIADQGITEKMISVLRVLSFEKEFEHWRDITLKEFVSRKEEYYDLMDRDLLALFNEFIRLTAEQDDCTVTDEIMSAVADVLVECGKILPYIPGEQVVEALRQPAIKWMNLCFSPLTVISSDVLSRLFGALQLTNLFPMVIRPVINEPQNEAVNNIFWPGNTDHSLVN